MGVRLAKNIEKLPEDEPKTGVIPKGWLSAIWTVEESSPDAHLDDVEILVDCE